MQNRTLILTGPQIRKLVSMAQVLKIVEKAFVAHGQGRIQMPAKIYVHLDKYNGDFRAMPAYIESLEACGVKWVNVHPANKKIGLPTVMALIILSDPRTGFPLAIMDGTYITNLRTGASGGIAAKFLAKGNSSRIGMVGCGVQAFYQLAALNELFDLKCVSLYDNSARRVRAMVSSARQFNLNPKACRDVESCVREKDIVVTTTPSRSPIVRDRWISPGTHINAVGADAKGKEELDPAILKRAEIVVDDYTQAIHSGEINVPVSKNIISRSDIRATLGEVIIGKKKLRTSPRAITVFDSTGLAIHDVAVASYVYRKAKGLRRKSVDFIQRWKK